MPHFEDIIGSNLVYDGEKKFELPGAEPHYPPSLTFDVDHIRIEAELEIEKKWFKGKVTHHLRSVSPEADEVAFDAIDFKNVSVYSEKGTPLDFDYDKVENKIRIYFPEKIPKGVTTEVTIEYEVEDPKLGLHFVIPDEKYPNWPLQAWTQGETELARFWLPCIDAPKVRASTELIMTVKKPLEVLSNGILIEKEEVGDDKIKYYWKLDQKHPSYLIAFAVGEFSVYDAGEVDGIPVKYFAEKRVKPEQLKLSFGRTPDMIRFLNRKLAYKYPWPKYYQVALKFFSGAMEDTSITFWAEHGVLDEIAAKDAGHLIDDTALHELAHQWFGDLVVIKHWSHAWLKEAMVTYLEACFNEEYHGKDRFLYDMYLNAQDYFNEVKKRYARPIVTNKYKYSFELYDSHLYPGGAWRHHMIRNIVGDEEWWKVLDVYLHKFAFKTVETIDYMRTIEEVTGKNLDKFFDQWVFSAGYPKLEVSFKYDSKQKIGLLRVKQTQDTKKEKFPLFDFQTEVGWYETKEEVTKKALKTVKIRVSKEDETFVIPMEQKPVLVRFDPNYRVLKEIKFKKDMEMLKLQATHDPDIIGRILAIHELGKKDTTEAAETLKEAFLSAKFWGVRIEAAKALGKMKIPSSLDKLLEILPQEDDPKVLRYLADALGNYREARAEEALINLYKSNKATYFVKASILRALGNFKTESATNLLLQALKEDSWQDVVRRSALYGLAKARAVQHFDTVKEYVLYGAPEFTRPDAFQALATLAMFSEKKQQKEETREILEEIALTEKYERIKLSAASALATLGDLRAETTLSLLLERESPYFERPLRKYLKDLRENAKFEARIKDLEEKLKKTEEYTKKLAERLDRLEKLLKKT